MTILCAGATGFIGQHLVQHLVEKGHSVIALSRNPQRAQKQLGAQVTCKRWNGDDRSDWQDDIEKCDAVINLIGEGIADKRWTDKRKKELLDSRVFPARIMLNAFRSAKSKPTTYIQASAIGIYRLGQPNPVDESGEHGDHFVARLCKDWEAAGAGIEELGVRRVLLRTAPVLHPDGGMLQKFLLPFRLFVGGPLGTGKQGLSWIHMQDMVDAIAFLLEKKISGPVNLCAPNPVTMNEFADALGRALNRPSFFRVPTFVLKIILGELSSEVVNGEKIIPAVLQKSGYRFKYETVDKALNDLL